MYFRLGDFGLYLRDLREKLGLTQEEVERQTGINRRTIIRYENGECVPKSENLDILSCCYREDLNVRFLEYRIAMPKLERKVELALRNSIHDGDIGELLNTVSLILSSEIAPFQRLYYEQIKYLILAIQADINGDTKKGYNLLSTGLKLSIPDFTWETYAQYFYSEIEARLLQNMVYFKGKIKNKPRKLEPLLYLLGHISQEGFVYPQICYQVADAYRERKQFKRAESYIDKGIIASEEISFFEALINLYYNKGLCQYRQNKKTYTEFFHKAYILAQTQNNQKAVEFIKGKCERLFGYDCEKNAIIKGFIHTTYISAE